MLILIVSALGFWSYQDTIAKLPVEEKLVVLTYNNVWLFEAENGDYFNGKISWLPIKAKQCEAICFDDDDTLIITNEQMELFELSISELIKVN